MKLNYLLILFVLIIISLGTVVAEDNSFHVSVYGNDTNTGSADSPFATINKAISSSDPSGNSIIYLGEGEFTGEGNTNLNINLNGGSLSIIGQGKDFTVINSLFSGPIFNSMSSSSNVELKGISFINGYAQNGGAIQSNANLKISDCLFENNYATGNFGGAIYWQNYAKGNITIENTRFIENEAPYRGGAVYVFGLGEFNLINCYFLDNNINNDFSYGANVYSESWYSNIVGNTFENTTTTPNSFDGGVYLSTRLNGTIIHNKFINCKNGGDNYGILYLDGNNYLNDNRFINSYTKMGEIYNDGVMNVLIGVTNFTIDHAPKQINLSCLITDVDENIVSGGNVEFYIDDQLINSTSLVDSEAMVSYLVSNYKNYDILVKYNNHEGIGNIVVFNKRNSTTVLSYLIDSNGTVNLIATVDCDEGNVSFNIDGNIFTVPVENGVAILDVGMLTPNQYNVTATYGGSAEYNPSSDELNFFIPSKHENNTSFIKLNVDINKNNNNVIVSAICSGNGTVIFTINGNSYSVGIVENKATLELENLEKGNYHIIANYSGNAEFGPAANETSFYIDSFNLESNDYVLYFRNGTRYEVKLTDDNQAVEGEVVTISINGVKYDKTTNSNGIASLALNLNPGVYAVVSRYGNVNCSNTVTILPTIMGNNLVKYFRNGSQYIADVLDEKGNPLKLGTVHFNINGVIYSKPIKNGQAILNIDLNEGDYIITAFRDNGAICSNIVKVLPIIVDTKNLVKYYRNGSQYSVKLLDEQGNPAKGETITFNINGVYYKCISNDDGIATLNINLNPGTYIITGDYKGFLKSNYITVKSTIISDNLAMTTDNRQPFAVTVLDEQGNPAAGCYVTFNINGVIYEKISDIFGIAKLDINLRVGEYIITTSYNGLMQSNYVIVEDK